MKEIVFPLLGVLLLIMVVGVGSQFLAARGKPVSRPERARSAIMASPAARFARSATVPRRSIHWD